MKRSALLLALALIAFASPVHAADWTPSMWTGEQTLQFKTNCPEEGEHWSYVWLVVLDGQLWIRLGSQAAGRADCSSTKPLTSVKIGNELFENVEMVQVPEMAERVAAAMAGKYWTDMFVRYMNHPYTIKLVPKADAAAAPAAAAK